MVIAEAYVTLFIVEDSIVIIVKAAFVGGLADESISVAPFFVIQCRCIRKWWNSLWRPASYYLVVLGVSSTGASKA